MGEARRRGTFEERKAQAIERDKKLLEEMRAGKKPSPARLSKVSAVFIALAMAGSLTREGKDTDK